MKAYRIQTELGDSYIIAFDQEGNIDSIKVGGKEIKVKFLGRGTRENEYLFDIDGKTYDVFVEPDGTLIFNNEDFLRLDRINEIPMKEGESIESVLRGKEGEIISPLFGRIVKIRVREGDAVNKGQPLLSIEAMKAETVISSPVAGIVQKVMVKEGQSVKKGDILLLIK